MGEGGPISWSDLSDTDRENFAAMLNRRFDAGVTVGEAERYYGDPERVKAELGGDDGDGPECPHCFTTLYQQDIPHIKRHGTCPNCANPLTDA